MEHKKPKPSRKTASHEPQPTPKRFTPNESHTAKKIACFAGKPRQPKSDGLQNNAPKDSLNSQRPLPKDSRRQTDMDLKNGETQNRKCRDETTASQTNLDFEFQMTRCPTTRVTRWWAGQDNATLTEPTSSHANCLKTR